MKTVDEIWEKGEPRGQQWIAAIAAALAVVACLTWGNLQTRATVQLPNYGNSANPLSTADTNGTGLTLCQRDSAGGGTFQTVYCSGIQNSGYLQIPVVSKTTTYTMSGTESIIEGNATGGAFPINLPAASSVIGRPFTIKKTDSSGNAVTVTAAGSDTIEGSATVALSSQWSFAIIISDGTQWIKLH